MAGNAYTDRNKTRQRQSYYKNLERNNNNPLRTTKRLVTNAGIAREAYFQSATGGVGINKKTFWSAMQTEFQANAPSAVSEASQLWGLSYAHKGMFATWTFGQKGVNLDDFVASKVSASQYLDSKIRYGFSFHYNPTNISMTYGIAPDIDPTMYTSGLEAFNDLITGIGTSTISFNIILNRLHDMQYFDNLGRLKPGLKFFDSFSGRAPTSEEQYDIWSKGTMYDIEFLLRTIMGLKFDSYLGRNMTWDKKTADIGFLIGKPVELHLGKSLRYTGLVEGLTINHVLFNERMVPTFSEVAITFTRIPDNAANTLLYPTDANTSETTTSTAGVIPGAQGYTYTSSGGYTLDDLQNTRLIGP